MHIYLMVVEEHGKTSAAKVLARAINCLNPEDGEPCNECEVCKGILSGSLTDVVEMDAASNNSVEDVRAIREEVNFLPTLAKYRVYIIDEVHMLSTGAFNALLKTLEEPPEHVKFILATTEPQKLPATILSRCQRFDFKKISEENIIKRLKIVCNQSDIQISEEALKVIAVLSEGAMRDALSILERCLQDGQMNIDEEKVKELVGIPKLEYVSNLTESIVDYNVENAINCVDTMINEGKDISNILWEIIKYTKDILVYKTSNNEQLYNKEEIDRIKTISDKTSKETLLNMIYELSEIENNIKWSSQKNIMFQTGIIKLCIKKDKEGIEELQNRISKLEQIIKNGGIGKEKSNISNNISKDFNTNTEVKKEEQKQVKKTSSVTSKKTQECWLKVLENLKISGKLGLYTNLIQTNAIELNDMMIGVEFPNGMSAFAHRVLETPEGRSEVEKQISIAYGKEMKVKYLDGKNNIEMQNNNTIEGFAKDFDIPIQIVE